MASSTRGGKRGKSKPKRKALKTYTTPSCAQQYGSPEAFSKLSSKIMDDALNEKDPKKSRDLMKAYYSADAGWESAMANKFPNSNIDYAKDEKTALERRKKYTNKMYGGKVTKMEQGGKVPSKYKGFSKLPENVQRQMDSGLAEKYEYGGKVGGCRGGGAAVKGTKFTGCK